MKIYLRRLLTVCNREKLKTLVKKLIRFLLNPRLLLCLLIAWMITNGWSYILFGLGMFMRINWMRVVGATYMSLLWLPFTPEKIITLLIAIALLRLFFPKDQRTLAVLRRKLTALRKATIRKVQP